MLLIFAFYLLRICLVFSSRVRECFSFCFVDAKTVDNGSMLLAAMDRWSL